MRCIVQRVSHASVTVNNEVVASINIGLLVLVGITHADTMRETSWMAEKLLSLRVFPDSEGKMNHSVVDILGSVLLVSQFTLYGELAKGTRPSFIRAARPETAKPLFEELVAAVKAKAPNITVGSGVFGAMMDVELVNDGPVTIILEREAQEL